MYTYNYSGKRQRGLALTAQRRMLKQWVQLGQANALSCRPLAYVDESLSSSPNPSVWNTHEFISDVPKGLPTANPKVVSLNGAENPERKASGKQLRSRRKRDLAHSYTACRVCSTCAFGLTPLSTPSRSGPHTPFQEDSVFPLPLQHCLLPRQ